jgi:putative phage-type endonuclease
MDRQEWLEARRKGIGATDAAAILGLSRWRTAIDVYEDKLGISPEKPATPAMQWGLALEDAIADAYQAETGRRVRRGGLRRAHHVRDFPMLATIDRLTHLSDEPVRNVELKTSRSDDGFADRDGWRDVHPSLRVPAAYYVQVQHQMEVLDVDVSDVAVLFGGSDFRIYEIPRDREYGVDLRVEEGAFWRDHVLRGIYPPAGADDLANLARRWSRSTDDERVATSEQAVLIETYLECVRAVEFAERGRDDVRARIEEAMTETGKLVAPAGVVTWRSHERTDRKWKEIANAYRMVVTSVAEAIVRAGLSADISIPTGIAGFRDASWTDPAELLDVIEKLYSATSTIRPFRVDRAKEKE